MRECDVMWCAMLCVDSLLTWRPIIMIIMLSLVYICTSRSLCRAFCCEHPCCILVFYTLPAHLDPVLAAPAAFQGLSIQSAPLPWPPWPHRNGHGEKAIPPTEQARTDCLLHPSWCKSPQQGRRGHNRNTTVKWQSRAECKPYDDDFGWACCGVLLLLEINTPIVWLCVCSSRSVKGQGRVSSLSSSISLKDQSALPVPPLLSYW